MRKNQEAYTWIVHTIIESFADGVTILAPDGLVLELNQRPLANGRLRREEVVGKPLADLPVWSSDPAVQQRLQTAIARASQGETVRFEASIHPREDLSLDLLMTITAHRDANQQIEYLICAGRDITERKRAEEDLRTLLDTIPHFVWMARADGSVIFINQRLIDYLVVTHQQAEGAGWLASVHPDDRLRVQQAWQTAIETGEPYEGEYRIRDGTSGAYRWYLVRGVPQRNAQGEILRWIGTCTDIEEQKRVEQQLKESRESLRVLAETVPQLVWTKRPDGQFSYTNQRWCDYTGLTLEQLQSDPWAYLPFLHPDDREGSRAHWLHALETGDMFEYKQRLRNAQTGEYRWFLVRALPVRDDAGQIIKWFGTSTDIEGQKRIEVALRQSQERVNALMNSSIIGIVITEGELAVDANDTALRMTGYTREDLQAGRMNWMQMTPPEYLARTLQAQRELDTLHWLVPYEKEYVCKDGSRLPVIVGRIALRAHPSQAIGFVLDNSARKELDQRKDDFINMASHELRNPLTALKMQVQMARRRQQKRSNHEAVTALSTLEGPIKQLERLIGELLDVSKIQAGKLEYQQEQVDFHKLLQEIVNTLRYSHPDHTIVVRAPVRASMIGDRDRLGQVFTNLISNAIKYSPRQRQSRWRWTLLKI